MFPIPPFALISHEKKLKCLERKELHCAPAVGNQEYVMLQGVQLPQSIAAVFEGALQR